MDHRLAAQQIARHAFETPRDVVAWLGAVQAQEYASAKWAVGLRLPDGAATDASIERAIAEGSILRAHALRGTWQFVAPADIRWILGLVAPRVVAGCARRYRELALDATTLRRSNAALAKALRAGKHLTRAELAAALGAAGISATGQRLAYLLQHAELAALICSGPRRGKQSTYALLDSRAPNPNPRAPLERDHALAELARRYFRSRGPATVKDFAWWSGLAAADARAGLEAVKSTLVSDVVDGETCWRTDDAPATAASPTAYVLPAFDEYLVAYRHRGLVLDPKHVKHVIGGGILGPCVVVDGRVVGTWRRVLARSTVAIAVDVFETQTRSERYAIAAAARRYAAFLGLEATIEVRTVTSRGRTLSQATPAPRRGRPRV